MDWKQRQAIALKGYKPSNNAYRVDVAKLRASLFPKGRIPLDVEDSWTGVLLPINTWGKTPPARVHATVVCVKSKSEGRGMRGMRLYVICPECGQKVSAGRLHQHYGYRH